MKDYPIDRTWWLHLSCDGQQEKIKMVYSTKEKGSNRSFWSFNMDWPDYLILSMAIVFGSICIYQYRNEEKFKNS